MGVIAQWGEINFEITTDSALLIHDLKLTAETDTEDKTKNKQGYASYKNGKAAKIDFDVEVLSAFGQDVRQIVTKFLDAAQRGSKEYFYVGGEKIFPAKTMMTKAEASEIEMSPGGTWIRAKISISLEQASADYIIPNPAKEKKKSGGGGGGGSGSGKVSVKTQDAVITYNVNGYTEYYYTPSANASTAQTAANAATAKAAAAPASTSNSAKNTSSAVTKTTTSTSSTKITAGLPNR